MNEIKIGDRVQRMKGDYVVGRQGDVIEINEANTRARVLWNGRDGGIVWPKEQHVKTWVSFSVIKKLPGL